MLCVMTDPDVLNRLSHEELVELCYRRLPFPIAKQPRARAAVIATMRLRPRAELLQIASFTDEQLDQLRRWSGWRGWRYHLRIRFAQWLLWLHVRVGRKIPRHLKR
jgi:hypothetical protein